MFWPDSRKIDIQVTDEHTAFTLVHPRYQTKQCELCCMLVVIENQSQHGDDLLVGLGDSSRMLFKEVFGHLGSLKLLLVVENATFTRQDSM